MNLLRNTTTHKENTFGFIIGKPEAELENIEKLSLTDVFEDCCNIFPSINEDGYFIIAGRKGTGKSSIAQYIKGISNTNNDTHVVIIKPNDIQLEKVIQAVPEADHTAIFEWVILTRLVKLILDCKYDTHPQPIKDLEKFYKRNTRLIDLGDYNIEEIIKNQELIFEVLRNSFGSIVSKKYKNVKLNRGTFHQFVPVLREVIQTVLEYDVYKNERFYICFDDIDVKFKISRDKNILADLIRTARNYNSEFLNFNKVKVLLFIREDLTKHLAGVDSDISKILDSSQITLNWYQHDVFQVDENNINLRQLINRRLASNFKRLNRKFDANDPWRTFVDHSENYGNKSPFSYILDFTYYTPRDLINIFATIGLKKYQYPLDKSTINMCINQYTERKIREISDELAIHYKSDYIKLITGRLFKNIASEIRNNGNGVTYDRIIELFHDSSINPEDFELLLEYDYIIPMDENKNIYCNYREQPAVNDIKDYRFTLHKCIYTYFNRLRL